jgi:hypothetical protein
MRRIPFLRPFVSEASQAERYASRGQYMKREAGRYSSDVSGAQSSGKGKSSGARPSAFLEVLESVSAMPDRLDLDANELRLGRSASQADIVLKGDATVSRKHATIVQEGSDWRIFDERSTSGSWVNEQRVPDYGIQLADGDEIRLGAVRLRFRQP